MSTIKKTLIGACLTCTFIAATHQTAPMPPIAPDFEPSSVYPDFEPSSVAPDFEPSSK